MNLARFLSPKSIRLEPNSEPPEIDDEEDISKKDMLLYRENIIKENAQLLYNSGKIQNLSKLSVELINRERRSTSIVGSGIAIPHVRSLQAKNFVMGFLRVSEGIVMDEEEQPIQIFIPMAAPPYDDKLYLKVYKQLAKGFLETNALEQLLEVYTEGEVIRIFNDVFR
ncbi:PTS sugar transporter subunit IIA [Candidatus Uabimicrobium amorphum]|uniref:PTS fructose transporter subunit IIABC n=1 Tax=Uabimicrobium amorphum TaxID=2596890 RepID=A0A5S9IQM0_UABAM|nr:PTS sugar transporter subunit IIA [Candidatus Uabimicrobium amorphum]BBM85780.1 PTS fructose transporter subunit IIABC [Candidatus Uabimicrobium amorphum]